MKKSILLVCIISFFLLPLYAKQGKLENLKTYQVFHHLIAVKIDDYFDNTAYILIQENITDRYVAYCISFLDERIWIRHGLNITRVAKEYRPLCKEEAMRIFPEYPQIRHMYLY